jgi:hypothetical protein
LSFVIQRSSGVMIPYHAGLKRIVMAAVAIVKMSAKAGKRDYPNKTTRSLKDADPRQSCAARDTSARPLVRCQKLCIRI